MELLIALRTLTTLITLTMFVTVTTLWTRTTLRALWTLTATLLWLYIVSGLFNKYAVRKLEFTSLWINLQQFHGNLVTFLDTSFLYCLQALPVNL
jgi:hypothetical protein